MSSIEESRGRAVVVKPGENPSYWQPVPANGHADPMLTPDLTAFRGFSLGFQTVGVGGHVREHAHGDQIEIQVCFRGKGHVVLDDVRHDVVPGTAVFLGPDVRHKIVNDGDDELVMLWVITSAGLEDFFKAIGRPRFEGDARPTPFARPTDVSAVERAMGIEASRKVN
ncbi:MAG: cupin domain-containing protein [Alphaproteobacteria bacterium]|nr:cupin domain-containing protein [Alphaproteobacteria bacterium]